MARAQFGSKVGSTVGAALRSRRIAAACLIAVLLGSAVPATAAPVPTAPARQAGDEPVGPSDASTEAAGESPSGLWIVELAEAPLASYRGGVSGLRATSPEVTGADRLDVTAPRSEDYLDHLTAEQDDVLAAISEELGRDVSAPFAYQVTFNGLAVEVDASEAARIAQLPGVEEVTPDELRQLDTDVSPALIGAPEIWEGTGSGGVGTRGEGVVVGMIDTGVNPDHPSFAAVDGDGYRHSNPFGEGVYVGLCDPANRFYTPVCNDKLVGAWDFTSSTRPNPRDTEGHGSHTGSTMAGNKHEAQVRVGTDVHTRVLQGIAPRANVVSYKVCTAFGCLSSASVAAVDQAVVDGVDVLNYSISGSDNPWVDIVDRAFLEAYEAGVFIAASAGNDGPGEGTVAKTGPWNASVAATSHERVIANALDVVSPTPPPELTDVVAVLGDRSPLTAPVEAPLRYVTPADPAAEGCAAFPEGAFDGAIALIRRGGCNFAVKIGNAADAGAVAVVVFNQFGGPAFVMGEVEGEPIPAVMVGQSDGEALRDLVAAEPVVIRIGLETRLVTDPTWADVVADFSARGPSQFDLLAPTFAAPGRNILAAYAADGEDPAQYAMIQGTSMASPHAAGAGALLKALHPDWSPSQIRSALALSARRDGIRATDGAAPANPFEMGSGRLDLGAAGRIGVVLDETHADFLAANPATGGDPKTLNLPALVNQACDQTCSWTRELTSVSSDPVTYAAALDLPDGFTGTVTPATFTLEPGTTQTLTVALDVSTVTGGDWEFGSLELTAAGAEVADVHLPVVVVPAEPELVVAPAELASTQGVDDQVPSELAINNAGGAQLEWSVRTTGPSCKLPGWATVAEASGEVDPGGEGSLLVTFDSSDLAGGVYEATLCVDSNDPYRPRATVPLRMEVVEVPVVTVDGGAIDVNQPEGTTTGRTFAVANSGYGELDWTVADPDAGPSDERVQQLRDGVLLVPNSNASQRAVMAFDPQDGTLIDPRFVPHFNFDPDSTLYTPIHVLPNADGTGFLLADQVNWVISEYDLDGNFRRIFAPVGGYDPQVLGNVRGMAWSPGGTLLVTAASGANANSVVELDADGNYLGRFIEPGLDGLNGPWYALFRDDDVLVGASGSQAIHSFGHDGTTVNPRFASVTWPEQLAETADGHVLAANWSGSSTLGVLEFDADGALLGRYLAPGNSYGGVHQLGNGNILTTTSAGVYEIDRAGGVQAEYTGGRGRFITHVQLPDMLGCSTPDEVPWLAVSADSGSVARGESDAVTVTLDSSGLAAGTYRAQLCVTSDDPDSPLVAVPVTLTVTSASCDRTVTDQGGPLAVRAGLTCLAYGSSVGGAVAVSGTGSLYADGATIRGPLGVTGAGSASLSGSLVRGPVSITGVTGGVTLSGNRIEGPLACTFNDPPPTDGGVPNEVRGPASGQCAGFGA